MDVKGVFPITEDVAVQFGRNSTCWLRKNAFKHDCDVSADVIKVCNFYGYDIGNADIENWNATYLAGCYTLLADTVSAPLLRSVNEQAVCLDNFSFYLKENCTDAKLLKTIDGFYTLKFNRLLTGSALSTLNIDSFVNDISEVCAVIDNTEDTSPVKAALCVAISGLHDFIVKSTEAIRDFYALIKDEAAIENADSDYYGQWTPIFAYECAAIITDDIYFDSFSNNIEISPGDIAFDKLEAIYDNNPAFAANRYCNVVIDNPYSANKEWDVYKTIRNTYYVMQAITY